VVILDRAARGAKMDTSIRIGGRRTFGRRETERPVYWAQASAAESSSIGAPIASIGAAAGFSFPYLTAGLVVVLTAIFWCELQLSSPAGGTLTIDGNAYSALGGVGRALLLHQHEWWRFFTAPWLHGGLDHLVGNLIVLVVVGTMLERLVGRGWLAAAFIAGAWGGSIGSLIISGSSVGASIGASGAIMGLLGLLFTLSYHDEAGDRGRRFRRFALFFLIPALAPSVPHNGIQIDVGAHFGGVVAGTAVGFLLLIIWPEGAVKPPHARVAALVAASGLALTAASFAFAAASFPAHLKAVAAFAPRELAMSLTAEGRTDELVERYPHDPMVRLLRADHLMNVGDLDSAIEELRTGLDERAALTQHYAPSLQEELQYALVVALAQSNREDDAREVALHFCAAVDASASSSQVDAHVESELVYLKAHAFCS
jgi:membrane associated rhomboid family serine protease